MENGWVIINKSFTLLADADTAGSVVWFIEAHLFDVAVFSITVDDLFCCEIPSF